MRGRLRCQPGHVRRAERARELEDPFGSCAAAVHENGRNRSGSQSRPFDDDRLAVVRPRAAQCQVYEIVRVS